MDKPWDRALICVRERARVFTSQTAFKQHQQHILSRSLKRYEVHIMNERIE